jgi:hypothetical protein
MTFNVYKIILNKSIKIPPKTASIIAWTLPICFELPLMRENAGPGLQNKIALNH